MQDLETTLGGITMAPYIVKAMALIGVRRRAGSNMFRHQISTMGILLDYKIVDPVLLKAAVIHDLFEEAAGMPGVTECRDLADRLRRSGSLRAGHGSDDPRRRRCARAESRIPAAHHARRQRAGQDPQARRSHQQHLGARVRARRGVCDKYLHETRTCILPHAEQVNPDMFKELSDLVESRERLLTLLSHPAN